MTRLSGETVYFTVSRFGRELFVSGRIGTIRDLCLGLGIGCAIPFPRRVGISCGRAVGTGFFTMSES